MLTGLIGVAFNKAVATYRILVGRQIDSPALVVDGVHARTDGFTSLAVRTVDIMVGLLTMMSTVRLADLGRHCSDN